MANLECQMVNIGQFKARPQYALSFSTYHRLDRGTRAKHVENKISWTIYGNLLQVIVKYRSFYRPQLIHNNFIFIRSNLALNSWVGLQSLFITVNQEATGSQQDQQNLKTNVKNKFIVGTIQFYLLRAPSSNVL